MTVEDNILCKFYTSTKKKIKKSKINPKRKKENKNPCPIAHILEI